MTESIVLGHPPITCHCGVCVRCRQRVRQRELRAGVERYRVCAADGCDNPFYAVRANTKYCSSACRQREAQRRYNSTEKARVRKHSWLADNPDKSSEYAARWYRSGGNAVRAAYRLDKGKWRAHAVVAQALRSGRLIRQPCEVCGAVRVDAHHPDYNRPLDVCWLCRRHHRAIHAEGVVTSPSKSS